MTSGWNIAFLLGSAATLAPSAQSEYTLTEMPPAFRGRWGMVPEDCVPATTNAKGLVTIEARRLRFHGASATFETGQRVDPRIPDGKTHLFATLAFTRGSRRWKEQISFDTDGSILRHGSSVHRPSLTYIRCSE